MIFTRATSIVSDPQFHVSITSQTKRERVLFIQSMLSARPLRVYIHHTVERTSKEAKIWKQNTLMSHPSSTECVCAYLSACYGNAMQTHTTYPIYYSTKFIYQPKNRVSAAVYLGIGTLRIRNQNIILCLISVGKVNPWRDRIRISSTATIPISIQHHTFSAMLSVRRKLKLDKLIL